MNLYSKVVDRLFAQRWLVSQICTAQKWLWFIPFTFPPGYKAIRLRNIYLYIHSTFDIYIFFLHRKNDAWAVICTLMTNFRFEPTYIRTKFQKNPTRLMQKNTVSRFFKATVQTGPPYAKAKIIYAVILSTISIYSFCSSTPHLQHVRGLSFSAPRMPQSQAVTTLQRY